MHNINGHEEPATRRQQKLINGHDDHLVVDTRINTQDNKKLAKVNRKPNTLVGTTGSNTQMTQNIENINGVNGETGQKVTTTMHTVTNGYREEGNKKIQAKGSANVEQTNAASSGSNTVVTADGSTVTTVKSAKSSSVKYAVEASTIQEEIIR